MTAADILFVVTSQSTLGPTDNSTGWDLEEVAYPYRVFKKEGHNILFVSPHGGKAPMDPGTREAYKEDIVVKEFLEDKEAMKLIDNTKKPSEVNASDFKAIYYPGGLGAMFDIPQCKELANLAVKIYENGGIIGAVGHGVSGLVPLVLTNHEHLVKGKTVTSFTNFEEKDVQMKLSVEMPFPLETKLKDLGAEFIAAHAWEPNMQVDGRLITGQNLSTASAVALEMARTLKALYS